jgi:hypothetical protein
MIELKKLINSRTITLIYQLTFKYDSTYFQKCALSQFRSSNHGKNIIDKPNMLFCLFILMGLFPYSIF